MKQPLNRRLASLTDDWHIVGRDPSVGFTERLYADDTAIPDDAVAAAVPTTVRNALLRAGRIDDPYEGLNSLETKWVEDKEWWFLRDFAAPGLQDGERLFLRFEGITYRAEVWVNGLQAGYIEGMFREDRIEITPYVRAGESNRLALRIRAQENARLDDDGSPVRATIRSQAPVMQCTYYWNWCPHMVPIGIWQPVHLEVESARVRLADQRVHTLRIAKTDASDGWESPVSDAVLRLRWGLEGGDDAQDAVELAWTLSDEASGEVVSSGTEAVGPVAREAVCTAEVSLASAKLWWPNGSGEQPLYVLRTRLHVAGALAQEQSTTFGVRTVEFRENEDEAWVMDTTGHTFRPWSNVGKMYGWTITINGRPIFAKGSNWVLLDALLRLEPERYDRQLRLVRDGGLNFLRVWAGSLCETEAFYDLCNRYGILTMQEFWLACGNYPAMRHDLFLRCVADNVRRLASHPSLIFYSGGNEYNPDQEENRVLVDKVEACVEALDPTRPFRRGSPYKGDKHGGLIMTPFGTRNKYRDVLPGDRRVVLFRSEVAIDRSVPMWSSLEKIVPTELPIDDRLWHHHFAIPWETRQRARDFAVQDDFRRMVLAGQLHHAITSRYNLEYCRSQMFRCTGNLNWQFNVPWPCFHREIVDTWGVPKPAYYHYRESSREAILTLDHDRYLWHPGEMFAPLATIANDGPAKADCRAAVVIYDKTGREQYRWEKTVTARENHRTELGTLEWMIPGGLAGQVVLVAASLHTADGQRLARTWSPLSLAPVAVPDKRLCLDGDWEREDGSLLPLPGNDMTLEAEEPVSSADDNPDDLEGQAEKRSRGNVEVPTTATYRKRFTLPADMAGADLEFFTYGIEASDEVYLNGTKIGAHTFRGAVQDHAAKAFRPHGGGDLTPVQDDASEYWFQSDPMTMPRLAPRFYAIPRELLRTEGENVLELVMHSRFRKAIYNSFWIRERTSEIDRKTLVDFIWKGAWFGDLAKMAPADLTLEATPEGVALRNAGNQLAFFVQVEVIPKNGIAMPLDDNALTLLAGEVVTLGAMDGSALPSGARVEVYGWNLPPQQAVVS